MTCENCGKEHNGSYGSGRFCSKECRGSFCAKMNHWSKETKYDWNCRICHLSFHSRKELQLHLKENHMNSNIKYERTPCENPHCPFCGEYHKYQYAMKLHIRYCKLNSNRDIEGSKKISNTQKEVQSRKEVREKKSKSIINNPFWKYRSENPIFYKSKHNGILKLDSDWELIVAKRLDELNINWFIPIIRIPYIDIDGIEKGYFPDFYVEDYHCFIEVKAPYITKKHNENGKIDYLKSHYDFILWLEDEESCKNFTLIDLGYKGEVKKEIKEMAEDIRKSKELDDFNILFQNKSEQNYQKSKKIKVKKIKEKKSSERELRYKQIEKERWNIIQNSGIDFQSFGWVIEISKLFNVATNKGGKYIKKHFPQFYATCYQRKS